jgi:hypothetical protein
MHRRKSRTGWVLVNRGGWIVFTELFRTRTEIVKKLEKDWNQPWRRIKKKYDLAIVRGTLTAGIPPRWS